MRGLHLTSSSDDPLRILCIGAHADDIEIGCGGTLMKILNAHPHSILLWAVFSAADERAAEARATSDRFMADAAQHDLHISSFRDGFFPYDGAALKLIFEETLKPFEPTLIFTHHRSDRHQDHRTLSDLSWNTFRDHLILEYEIPKYDGDLGHPNLFVALDETTSRRKVKNLMDGYPSQQTKHWFTEETFYAMLRMRGVESRNQYAEAFHCRKMALL